MYPQHRRSKLEKRATSVYRYSVVYIVHLSTAKTGRLISKDKRDWVTLILFRIILPRNRSLAESVLFSGLPIYTRVERQLSGWLAGWHAGINVIAVFKQAIS